MEKVVLLARVSTDKQEFNRQITELKSFCGKMNWDIVGTFANKVSGAETIENRTEIVEMVEFVRENEVKRVVCLEISRLGRMHSDAQFAGSSSVPAHVEMMGFLGMGNNPMVGATVAVAVAVQQAMK